MDGIGQSGAGPSDMRVGGRDLQHARQLTTADEWHEPIRTVRQQAQGGGPMKEHMTHHEGHHPHQPQHGMHPDHMKGGVHEHLEHERKRHDAAHDHHMEHLARHHGRHHNAQHGHG